MPELDKEFLEYVVKRLVDNPDDVQVERTIDEMGVLLILKVNPKDMGQIIGKEGQTARSLRTLLRVIGAKNNARVNLKIYEPEGSRRGGERGSSRSDASSSVDEAVADLKL
ncbi:MAG: KH domain-containing protein [Candidatus Komeilibacteria bacterium]|nr:KH domain-containing protein [Candidatus Komeilibacteria bacterium]